jgi:hypothetical protein
MARVVLERDADRKAFAAGQARLQYLRFVTVSGTRLGSGTWLLNLLYVADGGTNGGTRNRIGWE